MSEKAKILVVEDEVIVACDIRTCLVRLGYLVNGIATSGEGAIARVKQEKPDLVLMDITLKGQMDGVEAADYIRNFYDIPIVYLTAHADEHTLTRAKTSEVYGYVLKPFEERDLRVAIEIALYKHKMELKLGEYQTARHEAERLYEELQATSRLKDEFLTTISHELRTPLNAIMGYADLIRSGACEDQEELDNAIDIIYRNAKAQHQLIAELLDTSRMITGKFDLQRSVVDLADIARAAMQSHTLAASVKQIKMEVTTLGQITPVFGDLNRLQQVIWNLLSNAIKFTPEGGRVDVHLREHQQRVEVAVTDTGDGIDSQFLAHAFERFRQENGSTSRSTGGLGLGLAIVRCIVEMHGGEVELRSAGKGQGTTCCFRIPVAYGGPMEAAPASNLPTQARDLPKANVLDGVAVLVIEDVDDSRQLVKAVLEQFGARVDAVESARQGLKKLHQRKPDVILCDIGMPEMDGYDFLRAMRAIEREAGAITTPAAALTAYAGEENRRHCLAVGFQDHIAKPFATDKLIEVVMKLSGRPAPALPPPGIQ